MADTAALKPSTEFLDLIIKNLITYRPDLYFLDKNIIQLKRHQNFEGAEFSTDLKLNRMHPLDLAARLVQEDLLIMLPPNKYQRGWWMAAGSLAFPSRWNLKDKFKKNMDAIHVPVPFYKDQLRNPTNNFFNQMPFDQIFARRNWSLHHTPSLRQDEAKAIFEKNGINSKNAGNRLWLRVERQTLTKIRGTEAILFTIRIHIHPLKEIVKFKGVAKRLKKAISVLPHEMQVYKNIDGFFNPVQEYLSQF